MLALTLSTTAWAQWSSDPNQNLALSDIPGADQVQPKVVPFADNGFFVSWFNNNPNDPPPNGYDTYLQRLDANGYEQFMHDGIQIAKLTNSSTEDYGLDIDSQGNALLAFLDTREDPNYQQVTVTKVSPSGEQLWGANGIQLTSGDPQAHQPKVTGTTDGGVVVAYTAYGPKYSFIVVQKFDANGKSLWASTTLQNNGIILSENKADYQVSDLHASDNGSVIVSFSRDTGFRSNRYLYANKFRPRANCCGAPLTFTCGTVVHCNWATTPASYPTAMAARYLPGTAAVLRWKSMCSTSTPTGRRFSRITV